MYCIDSNQTIEIRGADNFDYTKLDILFVPCTPNNITQTCMNNTLDSLNEYLDHPELYMITNKEEFNIS